VDDVGPRTNGDQSGKGPVMDETGVVFRKYQGGEYTADHGEQRIDGNQTLIPLRSCALMTLKPNQPTASIQLPSDRNGMLDTGMP